MSQSAKSTLFKGITIMLRDIEYKPKFKEQTSKRNNNNNTKGYQVYAKVQRAYLTEAK